MATITHSITLSTTDFNLVGDIRVRQADDETQVLRAKILEHGMIKSFKGLKPFFCLMAKEITGQGVSEEPVLVFDENKGTLDHTLTANAFQMVGRNEAYFSFRKELSNGKWAEQFSTRSFYYTVEKSIYTQPFKDSNYWWTFKELYRSFNEYIDSGKLTWEDFMATESDKWKEFLEQNREILESIDPGGVVLTELIDARYSPFFEEMFPNLKQRLDHIETHVDAQLAQTTIEMSKINAQVDFVDFVQKNRIPYDRMRFVKRANDAYQIWLSNQEKGIIYDFAKDPNDDFIKLNAGFSGLDKQGSRFVGKDTASDGDLSGSWMASGASRYTTTVGDSFTLKSAGERLVLAINCESRGGLWSIKVDGREPVEVSCYNPTTVEKYVVIAEGLGNVTHTVVGTFVGDDPQNPPSSTPSRGYLRAIDLPEKGTLTGYVGDVSNTAANTLMATASNKEFAFTVTKDGYQNWIPEHDAKGSAFQIAPPEFYVDGQAVDMENTGIGSGSAKEIGYSFEMKQYFYGQAVGYGPVMKIWTSHKIGVDGKLIFRGKMEALDTFEAVGYPMMLPAQDEFMNEFVTGIYNSKINDKSETYSYFSEEKDAVNSGAIISSKNKNLIVAGTLLNPIKTYRLGETGKPSLGKSLFLWNRSEKPKMYWQSMNKHVFQAGDIYRWSFELAIADIDGVYEKIKE